MSNQKHVVLTHSNALGGGVLISDIQVDAENITFTAEHGGKLTLSLKKCVGALTANVMGDSVMLNYFQLPVNAMVSGGNYGYGVGVAVAGTAFGKDYEAMVESIVVALFEHELTSRLIEPLRQTARELMGPRPMAVTTSYSNPANGIARAHDGRKAMFHADKQWEHGVEAGEPIHSFYFDYPQSKIVIVGGKTYTVKTACLDIRLDDEIGLHFYIDDEETLDLNCINGVASALRAFNPHVSNAYLRAMDIALGDITKRVDAADNLYLRDTAGEIGVVTDILFNNGLLTFHVSVGKRVDVKPAHLRLVSHALENMPTNTLGVLSEPVTDAHEVAHVYDIMRKAFPEVAAEYLQYMTPNCKPL